MMNMTPEKKSTAPKSEDTAKLYGNVSPVFEYWCLDCDEFFDSKELLSECPECKSSVQDNLVQIYMDHDPEPDILRSLKDFLAG